MLSWRGQRWALRSRACAPAGAATTRSRHAHGVTNRRLLDHDGGLDRRASRHTDLARWPGARVVEIMPTDNARTRPRLSRCAKRG